MLYIFQVIFVIFSIGTMYYIYEYGFLWVFCVMLFSNMAPAAIYAWLTTDVRVSGTYTLFTIGVWYWIFNFEPFEDMELFRALMYYYLFIFPIAILAFIGFFRN